jgi:pimeloyl-ACP methyl ester carboxylesterase
MEQNRLRPLTRQGIIILLLGAVFFFGCRQPLTIPIDSIRYDSGEAGVNRLLFVYLPGNGDPMTAFEQQGLVEAARARGLRADMIAVNAHLGYYLNGSVLMRLKQDVIDPSRAKGYGQIWLIGNSLGGFGSLSYALEHPDDIAGVVLLGPFPGETDVIKEIKEAGGLAQWDPGDDAVASRKDWEKHVWSLIKRAVLSDQLLGQCGKRQKCAPKIYLGYGWSDRFAYGQGFLGSFLPRERVLTIDGGHGWSTWRALWNQFLDQHIFDQ